MKIAKFLQILVLGVVMASASSSQASVTINFDVGEITSAGTLVNSGTFLFISHGADNVFNSTTWTTGSTFILGDDLLMGAFSISAGGVTSAIEDYVSPTGYGTTKFTGVFIAGLTSTQVNYSTGALNGGLTFGTSGGASYAFGSYRTDSIEGFGFGPSGNMAWVIPSDGVALSLFAASNTDIGASGLYLGADISAALGTSATLVLIPEPNTSLLFTMALSALATFRRRRNKL